MALERPRRQDGTITRLGKKLSALREARGWNQEDVATAIDYKRHSSYTKLETGSAPRPTAQKVLMLARLYGVSVDVLLRDELELPLEALSGDASAV